MQPDRPGHQMNILNLGGAVESQLHSFPLQEIFRGVFIPRFTFLFLNVKDYVRSVVIANFFGIPDIMMYNSISYSADNASD